MKKTYIAVGIAACLAAAAAITAAVMHGGSQQASEQSGVPDFVFSEAVGSEDSFTDISSSRYAAETAVPTTAPADEAAEKTAAEAEEHGSENSPKSTAAAVTAAADTDTDKPVQTAAVTAAVQSEAAETAADTAAQTEAAQSLGSEASTAAEPEAADEKVLVTSGDPLHYVRFEFGNDSIRFTGVYSGNTVTEVLLFRPNISSTDLSLDGDSFSGSLDVRGLSEGYYIIIVKLQGAGMYYVFEMTADGARAVPAEKLPAASNLAFADSPLELSEQGVLHQITVSDDISAARNILREIKTLSDRICAGITDDYDKARALCEWVSFNTYYDKEASENGVGEDDVTLEHVLQTHRSVCFGWSNLYAALCQAQGIVCYNASGSAVTGSRCFLQTKPEDERSHSWNLVVIDGRLIWVDTVWNSSNTYDKGSYFQASYDMQYFDIDSVLLSHDHRVSRLEYRNYFGIE